MKDDYRPVSVRRQQFERRADRYPYEPMHEEASMTQSPEREAEIAAFARHLLEAEGEQVVRDMAHHVGDEVHAVLKRHGMTMRTAAGAIGMGVLAAAQVLNETIAFARNSMDGEGADEIEQAAIALFERERRSHLKSEQANGK